MTLLDRVYDKLIRAISTPIHVGIISPTQSQSIDFLDSLDEKIYDNTLTYYRTFPTALHIYIGECITFKIYTQLAELQGLTRLDYVIYNNIYGIYNLDSIQETIAIYNAKVFH